MARRVREVVFVRKHIGTPATRSLRNTSTAPDRGLPRDDQDAVDVHGQAPRSAFEVARRRLLPVLHAPHPARLGSRTRLTTGGDRGAQQMAVRR